jgi:hypothetical protein
MLPARTSIVAAALVAGGFAALLIAGASPAQAAPSLSFSCSPGPSNCTGWYRSAVTVTFVGTEIVTMCTPNPVTVSNDTKGTNVTCNATGTGGTKLSLTVTIRVDRTPPSVTPVMERGPDANGWYTRAVGVSFSGSDATSGISSCTSATYGGPDTAGATLTGSCTDAAGNSAGAQAVVRFDATPPVVTSAQASRKPDSGRWYRRPVTFSFGGRDATSGGVACAPAEYKGPDGARVTVTGTCRDAAGNAASKAFVLSYDSTPPTLLFPRFRVRDGAASLRWTAGAGARRVVVERTPGTKGPGPSVVYRGRASAFRDRGLRTGARYRYLVTAYDQAGNAVRAARVVRALSSLRPAAGTRVRGRLTLAWAPVERARYYNVQIFRDGRKVLTFWPGRSWLHLPRLQPGRYRWYVWPGIGARARAKYGALLGSSTFVVR